METRGNDRPTGQSLTSEINITPLVDVMLVVLIIFMVVTPLLQQGVGVDLPQARNVADASEDDSQTLTVVLQGNGRMFLGTDPIDPADLAAALRRRHLADPGRQLQVKADRHVHYGEIKEILQAGRAAGFRGASLIAREIKPVGSGISTGHRLAEHGG
jgi:biopolymer transport protein ExbD